MKTMLVSLSMVLLLAGAANAGVGYDKCVREERSLRQKETDQCSGFSYMLNPSACFVTRKALAEYTAGKCREIGRAEGVTLPVVVPAPGVPVVKPQPARHASQPESAAPGPGVTMEQLQAENARLKAENARLQAELEQLKKDRP
ncbi:MAG TPA: hypothetical protein VIU41_05030 [Geobacteraceae bacterium]